MTRLIIAVTLVLLALAHSPSRAEPASQPTSQPVVKSDGRFIAYPDGVPDLRSPGFHKLIYEWTEDGAAKRIRFSLFLPHGYGTDDRRWPMLTFLAGLGDRGTDPGNAMAVGVPLEIGRSAELGKWMPMIVLSPQCPGDKQWYDPAMVRDVIRLIDALKISLPVDPAKLYVTGFSDGGKGTWALVTAAPRLFAVAAPVVSREYQADASAKILAGSGTTCLVISGLKDEKSEPASSRMVTALRLKGVDTVYAPIPNGGHFIWRAFYSERRFYEWLLLHRRGDPRPKDRPDGDYFVGLYTSHQQLSMSDQMFDYRMQRDLDKFEPYWFVDNCRATNDAGLQARRLDRTNVFVTFPTSSDIPCRLQTTRQLPKDKLTTLSVDAGHLPKSEWELVVRVNEQEQKRILVNDKTAPDGWVTVTVSLQSCAGAEARLQLIQNATTDAKTPGCWDNLKLLESPLDPSAK
jgi:hypothetical protein